jgi:mono/diheme cytochrome c family protein
VRFIQQIVATCLLSGVLAWLTMPSPSHAQDVGDVAKGRDYAARVCAQCHAITADTGRSPQPRVATFPTIANTPGMTAQALSIWLTTSHPTMPNLIIELEDRRNVVAYIVSLREPIATR